MTSKRWLQAYAVLAVLMCTLPAKAADFFRIAPPPGLNGFYVSVEGGVPDDGQALIGIINSEEGEPFEWTPSAGFVTPRVTYGGASFLAPNGTAFIENAGLIGVNSAQLWGVENEPISIETVGQHPENSHSMTQFVAPRPLSYDGSVIAGNHYTYGRLCGTFAPCGDPLPGRWTVSGGWTALPLPVGTTEGAASGMDRDGDVIVGSAYCNPEQDPACPVDDLPGSQNVSAFVWRNGQGTTALDPGPGISNQAFSVSADGQTIVGFIRTGVGILSDGTQAARWDAAAGPAAIPLEVPSNHPRTHAHLVSGDGSLIIGHVFTPNSPAEVAYWSRSDGYRFHRLQDTFASSDCFGNQLDGLTSYFVLDVTASGRTLMGEAIDAANNRLAWVAHLDEPTGDAVTSCTLTHNDTIPEPSSGIILVVAVVLANSRRCFPAHV